MGQIPQASLTTADHLTKNALGSIHIIQLGTHLIATWPGRINRADQQIALPQHAPVAEKHVRGCTRQAQHSAPNQWGELASPLQGTTDALGKYPPAGAARAQTTR